MNVSTIKRCLIDHHSHISFTVRRAGCGPADDVLLTKLKTVSIMTDLNKIRSITNFLGCSTVQTVLIVLSISVTTNQTSVNPSSLTDLFQLLAEFSD